MTTSKNESLFVWTGIGIYCLYTAIDTNQGNSCIYAPTDLTVSCRDANNVRGNRMFKSNCYN